MAQQSSCPVLPVELAVHRVAPARSFDVGPQRSQTTLQWVKERINPSFAEYLEAEWNTLGLSGEERKSGEHERASGGGLDIWCECSPRPIEGRFDFTGSTRPGWTGAGYVWR